MLADAGERRRRRGFGVATVDFAWGSEVLTGAAARVCGIRVRATDFESFISLSRTASDLHRNSIFTTRAGLYRIYWKHYIHNGLHDRKTETRSSFCKGAARQESRSSRLENFSQGRSSSTKPIQDIQSHLQQAIQTASFYNSLAPFEIRRTNPHSNHHRLLRTRPPRLISDNPTPKPPRPGTQELCRPKWQRSLSRQRHLLRHFPLRRPHLRHSMSSCLSTSRSRQTLPRHWKFR